MINKSLVFSFAAGVVVGALGLKIYNENKDTIDAKLKEIKLPGFANPAETENTSEATEDLTLEELMSQKERLEDLIAEYNSKKDAQ